MKQTVDVIVMFSKEGEIKPMRIRLVDEEGERRSFDIKSSRFIGGKGAQTLPDGMYISNGTIAFECKIEVHGRARMIRLYYTPRTDNTWTMIDEIY